jgi:hypothetical protein
MKAYVDGKGYVEIENVLGAYCATRDMYVYVDSEETLKRLILLDNMGARDDSDEAVDLDGNEYGWELKEHNYKAGVIVRDEVINDAWDADVKEYAEDADAWNDVAQSIHELVSYYGYAVDNDYDEDDLHKRNENV